MTICTRIKDRAKQWKIKCNVHRYNKLTHYIMSSLDTYTFLYMDLLQKCYMYAQCHVAHTCTCTTVCVLMLRKPKREPECVSSVNSNHKLYFFKSKMVQLNLRSWQRIRLENLGPIRKWVPFSKFAQYLHVHVSTDSWIHQALMQHLFFSVASSFFSFETQIFADFTSESISSFVLFFISLSPSISSRMCFLFLCSLSVFFLSLGYCRFLSYYFLLWWSCYVMKLLKLTCSQS